MAYSGKFNPINPGKYLGDYKNIVYRSSWECRVMNWLDKNPNIINWGSEEVVIPYISPIDKRPHRYFPDFFIKVRTRDSSIKTMIVEIKPERETKPPKNQKRITKKLLHEAATYGINQAKWKAAEEYCADRKWEFKVLTEKDLGI